MLRAYLVHLMYWNSCNSRKLLRLACCPCSECVESTITSYSLYMSRGALSNMKIMAKNEHKQRWLMEVLSSLLIAYPLSQLTPLIRSGIMWVVGFSWIASTSVCLLLSQQLNVRIIIHDINIDDCGRRPLKRTCTFGKCSCIMPWVCDVVQTNRGPTTIVSYKMLIFR